MDNINNNYCRICVHFSKCDQILMACIAAPDPNTGKCPRYLPLPMFGIGERVYFNISERSIEDEVFDVSLSFKGVPRYRTKYSKKLFGGTWYGGYIEHEHGFITKVPSYPEWIVKQL